MNLSQEHLSVCTTCPYCGVGCGVKATPQGPQAATVTGDAAHPSNFGKLCVKGSALGETLGLDGRLLHPQVREDGQLRQASWDEALDRAATQWRAIVDEHGPDAVALYVSGQLLTEDYYVANKLMKGYVGSANIDTNSRLCMSSAVAGHKRAFGEDLVPVNYEDLDIADMVVLVGSNTAWCHPILFQRILRAKEARPHLKIVVIDPRRTATCEVADLHLPVKPGTDVWLFNGLLSYLSRSSAVDAAFIANHTRGLTDALEVAEITPEEVAQTCRLKLDDVLDFYEAFAATAKVITGFSMGVNQSSAGTDKVNAIINCHLVAGRIGKPGMGPFSITGQPNAMGGREVGGLANMLAAHLDLDQPTHRAAVQGFWGSPRIADKPGLKAVDLFQAIETGRVKAVWVIATNPVVSLPEADQVRRALAKAELVIASDVVAGTDTNAFAHVLLPALAWGEKDGTVTNSERRISRQRAFLPAPGEARADWQILSDFAQRLGYDGFGWSHQGEIFAEHARLSAWRNVPGDLPRAFEIGALAALDRAGYDALEPVQWPIGRRVFADHQFSFPDGRARFVPTAPRLPVHMAGGDYPLVLNTGRVRDQWHTMTRTGRAPTLAGHTPESFVDLHPQDALLCGVKEGELARIASQWGSVVARVRHGGGIARGSVFIPIHWNGQTASDARVGAVVNPVVDPVSGEPEFKHTPVSVDRFPVQWHGFVLSRTPLGLDTVAYWTRVQGAGFNRYELAGRNRIGDFGTWARELLAIDDEEADWLEYADRSNGVYRAVHVVNDRIEQCIFVSPRPDLPERAWLASLFAHDVLVDADRAGVLAGRPLAQGADTGPTVCSCFGVGRNTICNAIRDQDLKTTAEVTACTKAGGNCGSCVPEIRQLLTQRQVGQQLPA
ncbi:assimilatory nitrate reductase catalytic subunit [Pseudoduganella lurida]|uniref:Assimilatory nitrate reductase catalytic subunit n=1 Tax=Pseudoduganella lurida TaxID=1036180 RepID=A0A562RCC2_9BURK|nr:nitrate reductase [Pseudoduganella lurida]TWI66090.1 assimilatory nitrate reductase catalytic subunit [Pseudoduganella lurida]